MCRRRTTVERRKRPEARVLVHVQSQRVTVQQGGRETLCQSPPRAPLQVLVLTVRSPLPPTTVSSASWHFSWLRRRSLPEQLFPACAANRTWQLADASTQSGSATLVSQQQQQQQQHRTAAAHTTNYSTLDQSYLSRSPSSHILFMDCNTGHPFA